MSPSQTFTPSTPALAADVNAVIQDIADEITNSVAKDGQTVMTGALKAADGSAAAPSFTFGSDLDSGFYRKGSNNIAATANGAIVWEWTASGITMAAGKTLTFPTTGAGLIPSGGIIMWSGTIAAIPTGWFLCNGLNGTPDLRNRFIIGAQSDDAGAAKTTVTGPATLTGGSKDAIAVSHTHTATTDAGGAHGHDMQIQYSSVGAGGGSRQYWSNATVDPIFNETKVAAVLSASDHTHTLTTDSAGLSGANANLPPYYAAAILIKT
jgi:hypothetical protein